GEGRVGDFDGEFFRVELLAKPLQAFGALGMGGVCDDVQQLLIAPRAAAILRRTSALACDACRVDRSLGGRKSLLDRDGVLPVVAVMPAADVEGMEVAAFPAHRCLDRLMQVAESHVGWREKPTPDRRLRAAQRHFEADDAASRVRSRFPRHAPAPAATLIISVRVSSLDKDQTLYSFLVVVSLWRIQREQTPRRGCAMANIDWRTLPPLWPSPAVWADVGCFMLLVFTEDNVPRWEVRRKAETADAGVAILSLAGPPTPS